MKAEIQLRSSAATAGALRCSVVTHESLTVAPEEIWRALLLYEQIDERPPWYLRLLLPVPRGTRGSLAEVGDSADCLYEQGHLVKRVTEIEHLRRYRFDVVEQQLRIGGGIRLTGGCYELQPRADGGTDASVETGYIAARRPRWFWRPIESRVCAMFHRHLLHVIERRAMVREQAGA